MEVGQQLSNQHDGRHPSIRCPFRPIVDCIQHPRGMQALNRWIKSLSSPVLHFSTTQEHHSRLPCGSPGSILCVALFRSGPYHGYRPSSHPCRTYCAPRAPDSARHVLPDFRIGYISVCTAQPSSYQIHYVFAVIVWSEHSVHYVRKLRVCRSGHPVDSSQMMRAWLRPSQIR